VRELPNGLGDQLGARGEYPSWCDACDEVSIVGGIARGGR
jgi:hypothetical protein